MRTRNCTRAATRRPPTALLAALALPACLALLLCPAGARAASTALSPSAYGVSALCAAPSPGHAGCLGLRLVANAPLSLPGSRALPAAAVGGGERSTSSASPTASPATEFKKPIKGALTPADVQGAYGLATAAPASTQTIGIVDAYDDAGAQADLETFNAQYGLPQCNEANGCFRKLNQLGKASPLPPSKGALERGWAQEIATDIETAHGVCPSCRILLVEAKSNSNSDLYAAETTAGNLGAQEISNSWGAEEPPGEVAAFNRPGIVITASAGDAGYLNWLEEGGSRVAEYPATSPHVVAVGGTRLILNSSTKAWEQESVWNDGGAAAGAFDGAGAGGGGCSVSFTAPAWQQSVADWASVGCSASRAVADVSADADPYTGVSVYDSTENEEGDKGWGVIGGTSVASPIIASVFALAGGAHGVPYPARTLYESLSRAPASLHDVSTGSNGECLKPFHEISGASGCTTAEQASSCAAAAICLATPGYDGPTGVGTPNGIGAFLASGPIPVEPSVTPAPAAAATAAETPAPTGTSAPGSGASGTGAPAGPAAVISALALTRTAIAALKRSGRKISRLGFTFTLSASARVKVTIAKRVRVRRSLRWRTLSRPLTILAPRGRQSRTLSASHGLPRGQFQLTLTPEHGSPRSLVFRIH